MAVADDPLAVRLAYSPQVPEPPQHAFLLLDELLPQDHPSEALYGGAAGGGKSSALLMAALKYVDVPGYAALLLRRTYQDLALPGALMDRANTWLAGTDARWSGDTFRWTFPSSATLSFGYLQTSRDKYRYASAEFQFIGLDELTQFPIADYRFLFSRLRRPQLVDERGRKLNLTPEQRARVEALANVPLRMRAASNPGGRSHEEVRARFIERAVDPDDEDDTLERARRRIFVPAKLEDNPHVDQAAYRSGLKNLTRLERAYLEHGDWYADPGDRVYPPAGVAAAVDLGRDLDELADRGELPPPKGDRLAVGIDWGEHTAWVIAWPLAEPVIAISPRAGELIRQLERYMKDEKTGDPVKEDDHGPDALTSVMAPVARRHRGRDLTTILSLAAQRKRRKTGKATVAAGVYIVAAGHADAYEPGRTTDRILDDLGEVPAWDGAPAVTHPLELLDNHPKDGGVRFDAAGIQSQRTFNARARAILPELRVTGIPFGSYKRETIGYLTHLFENAAKVTGRDLE
jgi:hypothetical protein